MDAGTVLTLVQTFLQVLDSPISREVESVWGYKCQLDKLRETMSSINAVFLDVEKLEKRQPLSKTLKIRLERLQEAVYRADDLFDEVATVAQRKKLMSGTRVCKEVRLFFSRFNQLSSAFNMSREIRDIRVMLDDIKSDSHIHEISSFQPFDMEGRSNPRETHSFVCELDVIIGRDDDKRIVIDMLIDDAAAAVEEAVRVVSIAGIGGLGKTTLAQLVYNDDRIQKEFQLKMWVCVSDDFDVKALLGKIIAAATNETIDSGLSLEQVQMKIRRALVEKKYLLVLDDIWNDDTMKWQELRKFLIQGGMGSRIIVTTRSMRVANIVGSHQHTHELKGLSDEDSWKLFERMTLEPGQVQLEAHLVEVGKAIVSKCVNVPLAIRVMGSLLRGKGESAWLNMKHTDLANIKQDENCGIIPVLKISYNYLPSHLKSCFTYCAVFPKDYEIQKEELICLWMAQGFIMPSSGQNFEDLGEDYFINLLERCFFQDVKRDSVSGVIVSCKMHDLIHDLAEGVAGKGVMSSSINALDSKTRHIFIDGRIVRTKDVEPSISKIERVRTCLGWQYKRIWCYGVVPNMRYLRVLELTYSVRIRRLSSMIGQLVHLRYLDLSCNYELCMLPNSVTQLFNLQTLKLGRCYSLKELPRELSKLVNLRHLDLSDNRGLSKLPNSITQLFNLQTLKLQGCTSLKELPMELSKLVNLRHLDLKGCGNLRHMPPGMDRMTNLHKLTMFVVSNGRCWGSIGDLKYLNNLRDNIYIKIREGFTYDDDVAEVKEGGYLIGKSSLYHIHISFDVGNIDNGDEALLEGLQPHPNVKKLKLEDYSGVKFPSWGERNSLKMNLSTSLPNLVELCLIKCKRLKDVPLLSQLCHLKVLDVRQLLKLEYVQSGDSRGGDGYGAPTVSGGTRRQGSAHAKSVFFPSLDTLMLWNLPELKGWWKASSHSDTDSWEGHNYNEHLQQEIKESSIVAFPSLCYLQIRKCPNLVNFPWIPKVKILNLGNSSKVLQYSDYVPAGESFQHLIILRIEGDDEVERLLTMAVFRSGRLSSLWSLEFDNCEKMKSIRGRGLWEHLTALKSLKLYNLKELEMEMEEDEDDSESPWRYLAPSLRTLELRELPKMGKLPMGMQHLTALHHLSIEDCENLEEIPAWISCLTSLQRLDICYCLKVKSLPEQMRHLTSLTLLNLIGCSAELKERCQEQGADRHIIQHIPTVRYEYS